MNGVALYYLRSSVLGGQVVSEINGSGTWTRGYVYLDLQLVAVQQNGAVTWVHQDPVTKGQRLVSSSGALVSTIELDPFGGDTNRSDNTAFQPRHFTTYERDTVGGMDEAMARRYHGWWSRFSQPDPYDGSYSLGDPQSFNRYSYVQSDPVNFVDPSGLDLINIGNVGDVTIFGSFNSLLSGGGGRTLNDLFLPEEDVGERGGGTPQDPEPRKDCYDFVNEVEKIANEIFANNDNPSTNSFPHNVNAFMDRLAQRFTEVGSATIAGLIIAREHAREHGFTPIPEFGTEGFHRDYIDRSPGSDNQARHAVFGLIMGYSGIPSPLARANGREDASTPSGAADIALNNATVPMGQRITGGIPGHSGELTARGLADWIRDNICAPR